MNSAGKVIDAKVIITESGQRYAAIPLDDYNELRSRLQEVIDELELLKAERAQARMENGQEIAIPADVVGRVMIDGVSPLKAVREWRGISQEELARRAGTSKAYVSQLETGRRHAGRGLLRRLARALGVPPEVLMD